MKQLHHSFHKLIFFLTVGSMAIQTGKHFWPSWSFVDGIRSDYLSPTLYGSDILIILLFISWVFRKKREKTKYALSKKAMFLFLCFFVWLLIGILLSPFWQVGFYQLIKFIEFAFLSFYIATVVEIKKDSRTIGLVLCIATVFVSLLAIAQFFRQSSIGGVFWYFGERTFSGQTPGIATASFGDRLLLRPYATFPHPNVLAGFLLIALMLIDFFASTQKKASTKILIKMIQGIGAAALLLSLSRITISLLFLFWFSRWYGRSKNIQRKKRYFTLLFAVFVFGLIFFSPFSNRFRSLLSFDDVSYQQRIYLGKEALNMFFGSPVFGIGLHTFVLNISYRWLAQLKDTFSLLQPVHNIFLLMLAETGIVGFGFLCYLFFRLFKRALQRAEYKSNRKGSQDYHLYISTFSCIVALFIIGLFDHYLLTLQQGEMLFAFVVGFCFAKKSKTTSKKISRST